jgi:homogentisate 1,2-dioxygenase
MHKPYERIANGLVRSSPFNEVETTPSQLRWDPLPLPTKPTDFVDGLTTLAGNGDFSMHSGNAIHIYAANKSMTDRFFYSADGELLFVPQLGRLMLHTELGILDLGPGEIAIVPRGIKFRVELLEPQARGYVLENYGASFRLPELGAIGANGLANSRDFLTPYAAYDDRDNGKVPGQPLGNGLRPFAARRRSMARQLRALQIRSRALQLHQLRQLRPPRSIDLHSPYLTQRGSRYC